MERNYILRNLFIITNKAKRSLDKRHRSNGIFLGQARILRYLHQNIDNDIYQSDIEEKFQIRGGSASELINSLVKCEYLKRAAVDTDRRKKKLVLTKEGIAKAEEADFVIRDFESDITKTLNDEEVKIFQEIIKKMNILIDEEEKHI